MTGAQQVPVSSAAAATGGYPDYNRMQATQAGQPGAAPGAPQVDSTGAPDYSAYGKCNVTGRVTAITSVMKKPAEQALFFHVFGVHKLKQRQAPSLLQISPSLLYPCLAFAPSPEKIMLT